jgi:hypothetical protein
MKDGLKAQQQRILQSDLICCRYLTRDVYLFLTPLTDKNFAAIKKTSTFAGPKNNI